jgi:hypothetical protein
LGIFGISLGDLDSVGVGRAEIAGHDLLKARLNGEEIVVGDRIRPVPIPVKWLGRLGPYEIVNPGADTVLLEGMRLRQGNGLLLVDYSMPRFFKGSMSLAMEPLSDLEAVFYGLGRGLGETLSVETVQGEERLRYSGYLLKREEGE